MKTGKRKISVVAVKLLTCVCCLCLQPIPVGLAASPGLELTPVVVWQGVAVGEHHIKALAAIRGSLADLRVVHMANPVYLMRSGAEWNFYRNSMASLLKRGDVVG
ncbi:MAG: hypothetical protein NTV34_06005, partial [Proteobacteria bacterium]|nr:hypothetical protein [Pseudomonadota bacterium]